MEISGFIKFASPIGISELVERELAELLSSRVWIDEQKINSEASIPSSITTLRPFTAIFVISIMGSRDLFYF